MFDTHNSKINNYAQRNADNLSMVILMVVLSIQQRWSQVGHMLQDVQKNKQKSKYIWGNKAKTYKYIMIHKHFIYGQMMAILNSDKSDTLKSYALMNMFLRIDGLGIAKAGFVCQLVAGLVGCIDVHNIRMYKVNPNLLKYNKNAKTPRGVETNESRVFDYVDFCNRQYGTRNLWDSWCSFIADKYPNDFVDGFHVSELHYTFLTGEFNEKIQEEDDEKIVPISRGLGVANV